MRVLITIVLAMIMCCVDLVSAGVSVNAWLDDTCTNPVVSPSPIQDLYANASSTRQFVCTPYTTMNSFSTSTPAWLVTRGCAPNAPSTYVKVYYYSVNGLCPVLVDADLPANITYSFTFTDTMNCIPSTLILLNSTNLFPISFQPYLTGTCDSTVPNSATSTVPMLFVSLIMMTICSML